MPVQYEGIIPEHRAVRSAAGVFDVSHMGQLELAGPRARKLPASACSRTTSTGSAPARRSTRCSPNERGGIVDDLIVYRFGDDHAAGRQRVQRADDDREWLGRASCRGVVTGRPLGRDGDAGAAGPAALGLVELPSAPPFGFAEAEVCGVAGIVARTGYTGEPGSS